MLDVYTKMVLTLIAIALIALATENLLKTSNAQETCGSMNNPCVVTTDRYTSPWAVRIKSN